MATKQKHPGGRPKGVPNGKTKELRAMMEAITPGNEPVPMILLRMGFKYHQDKDSTNALIAIKGACEFAYPKLKAIELSGAVAFELPDVPIQGPAPVKKA